MSSGIYSALSGVSAQIHRLDNVANNIANVNTTGFKADKVGFKEFVTDAIEVMQKTDGIVTPNPSNDLSYVEVSTNYTDLKQGILKQTGNNLDVAIQGEGFFVVDTPNGERYTRNGNFQVNKDGDLTTSDGFPVLGQSGTISLEGKHVAIDKQGNIFEDNSEVDSLKIVSFKDLKGIKKDGHSLFSASQNAEIFNVDMEKTAIHQNFLEGSNVNALNSMVEMIKIQRHVDFLNKAIQTYKDLDSKAATSLGRSTG